MPLVIRLWDGQTLPAMHWHDLEEHLARADGLTVAGIADELNTSGTPTAQAGKRWPANTVRRILAREP
jgi:hypothetical protein